MIVKLNDLNCIIKGEGTPLLMLHGYLSNKESFLNQIDFFARYFKVVAVDLDGFNGQKLPYAFSLDDYKNSVNRLIDQLNTTKVHVIAHSFGVRILMKMLPENKIVDKIVITGGAGIKPRKSLKLRFKILKYKILKRFLKKEKLEKYGSSDYKALDGVMRESFLKIVNEHIDKRLVNIKNNALIVQGKLDFETPLYMAKKFKKLLKNSQLVLMENAGHFAFVDKPTQFNMIVKEFLL